MIDQAQNSASKKQLTNSPECGRIERDERWIVCPACGRGKVLKALPTTEVKDLPVYCKRCHQQSIVNISFRA